MKIEEGHKHSNSLTSVCSETFLIAKKLDNIDFYLKIHVFSQEKNHSYEG